MDKVEVHAVECRKRKRRCCYCDLELPWEDLMEHEEECGSRTERCAVCGEYVAQKVWPIHIVDCTSVSSRLKQRTEPEDNSNRKRVKKHSSRLN